MATLCEFSNAIKSFFFSLLLAVGPLVAVVVVAVLVLLCLLVCLLFKHYVSMQFESCIAANC